MGGKWKIAGVAIAVVLVISVLAATVPMVSARPTANQIDSGDIVYIGEQGLNFDLGGDGDYGDDVAGDGLPAGVVIDDGDDACTLEGVPDTPTEGVPIHVSASMTIPETTEGKYFYDANGNGKFDTGEFYVFIDHAFISGDIILNTAEQDSVVGKSVPTTTEIVFKIETNIGTQIPGACVDIEVLDPNSVKLTTIDGQTLDDVTILGTTMFVSDMPAGPTTTAPPYSDALDLTDLDMGTYKVRFKLDKTTCNMLDVSSSEMEFTIRSEELSIDVEDEVVSRGEDIIVNVCGNPETYYYLIITDVIEKEPPSIEFAGDVVNLPDPGELGAETVSVDIDNDGVYDHFLAAWIQTDVDGTATVRIDTTDADERTYTIKVYHNPVEGDNTPLLNPGQPGGPEWATERDIADSEDYDKVYVRVEKRIVTFDIPSTAAIGEIVTIRGTISAGETVDILIDDGDVEYFDDVPVDENKEFEVDWDTERLTKGSYMIDVYIDCDCSDYACIRNADLDPDGSTTIRLIAPGLYAKQLRNVVAEGDDYVIEGMATGVDYVDLVLIGPEGYPSDDPGLDVINGLDIVPISVTENEFSEEITMTEGLDTGMWIAMIFAPGRDGIYAAIYDIYGNPIGAGDLDRMDRSDLLGKDQEQIRGILMNKTINVAGSDDFLVTFTFKVESPYVKLNPVEPVMVGEPLNITGTTNREPGTIIMISTFTGPVGLPAVLTEVEWPTPDEGVFSATIDTSDAVPGTYILEAEDIDGNTDTVTVEIKAAVPTIDTGQSPSPYPSIFGTHNGTIVPANDITVSKIFVYPCVGTGGHAEYVRIWGNGVDAHATWNGYGGEDWNILHFNRTFTLEAGKEYNFTIKTGSYPQIFHEEVLETLDGSIVRCEEFVDANGKRHKWIPAFKIYA